MTLAIVDPPDQYERQFSTGFRGLRFDGELEAEYQRHTTEQQRTSARICAWVTLFLWSMFAALDIVRIAEISDGNAANPLVWIWLAARWLVLSGLVVLLLAAGARSRSYAIVAWYTYVALGISASVTAAIARSEGMFAADSAQIVVVMAAFLPLGYLFRRALAGALIVALFSIATLSLRLGQQNVLECLQLATMIVIAVPIAAIGAYMREYAQREQFLMRRLFESQAATDSLTSIPNRRHFDQHVAFAMLKPTGLRASFVVAIVDIDYFKQYNDCYGHAAGDGAIRAVAAALVPCARKPGDIVARIGGEEFGVFLDDTDLSTALACLEAALQRIRTLGLTHERSPHGIVTVSIGCAVRKHDESLNSVMLRADAALYLAKSSGRANVKSESDRAEGHPIPRDTNGMDVIEQPPSTA